MARLLLELQLLSDVLATELGASVGTQSTLGYVPGAMLLGALAARAYSACETQGIAWKVFHSGDLRIGPAYPMRDFMTEAVPMPLCFHHEKGTAGLEQGSLGASVVNLSRLPRTAEAKQYKQLRTGFLDLHGRVFSADTRASMRTAINENGQAREGYLYGLEGIEEGTKLLSCVESDHLELLKIVQQYLAGQEIRLGRARGAEFGRALVTIHPSATRHFSHGKLPGQRELLFFCQTDCCLRNEHTGQPTLTPTAKHFGLSEDWTLDGARSFVRTRRYSPFNTKRGRPSLERQVIVGGSVFLFTRSEPLSEEEATQCQSFVDGSVGEYREEGLGRVLVCPAFLESENPTWVPSAPPTQVTQEQQTELPKSSFGTWIQQKIQTAENQERAWRLAKEWLQSFEPFKKKSPTNAQWGELRNLARRARTESSAVTALLRPHLIAETQNKTGRVRAEQWKKSVRGVSVGEWLLQTITTAESQEHQQVIANALELFASRVVRSRMLKGEVEE